jgi:hypothetical protein
MSDNLTFAELEAQQVELLPARTVLSLISLGKPGTGGTGGTCKPGIGYNFPFTPGSHAGECHVGANGSAH